VKVCPQVNLNDIHFLEPPDENKEGSSSSEEETVDQRLNLNPSKPKKKEQQKTDNDDEGTLDPETLKKFDDENMNIATDKLFRKEKEKVKNSLLDPSKPLNTSDPIQTGILE